MSESFKPKPFGKYLLIDRIAIGGMAEIYKAKQYGIGGFEKMLVIKKILPHLSEDKEFVNMFIDEAKISVSLSHSNLAQVYELGQIDNTYFIAMEFIEGKNLREITKKCISKGIKLSIEQVVYIVSEVCKGLDYAHRKKRDDTNESLHIIHRDISPQNVMISYEGEVKVVDFGIAKAANKITQTQAGVLKGKFGYMSPEQARGEEIDSRSDIFSVGIMMWELLAGKRLFLGETDFDTLEKVKEIHIDPPSTFNNKIPESLDRISLRVLERDQQKRYQTAGEFQLDLTKFLYSTSLDFAATKLTSFMKTLFADEIRDDRKKLSTIVNQRRIDDLINEQLAENSRSAQENSEISRARSQDSNSNVDESFFTYDENSLSQSNYSVSKADVPPPSIPRGDDTFYQTISYISDIPEDEKKSKSGLGKIFKLLFSPLMFILKSKKLLLLIGLLVFGFGAYTVYYKDGGKDERLKDRYKKNRNISQKVQDNPDVKPIPMNEGYVTINVNPADASIDILNVSGTRVKSISGGIKADAMKIGHYKIIAQKEGFTTIEKEIDVKRGRNIEEEIQVLEFNLEKIINETTLYISSSPPGARIYLNNQNTGLNTPTTINKMTLGETYKIKLTKEDYKDYSKDVMIQEDAGERLMVLLDKMYGKFNIKSDPVGADIYIDGKHFGKTPLEVPGIKLNQKYNIKISLNNNKEYHQFSSSESISSTIFPKTVYAKLKVKPPTYGIISFQATPWAYIYVNGTFTNETTYSELKMKTGKYEIELQNPNYPTIRTSIEVKKDKTIKLIGDMATGKVIQKD
ncbi:MAG: serine/threonine-protein kinase [Pseudomonadota bacterium]